MLASHRTIEIVISISAKDCFKQKRYNLLWVPPTAAADIALGLLLESRLHLTNKSRVMLVPKIIKISWRNQMGKEVGLLFTVPVEMPFCGLGEHEPLRNNFFY